MKVVTCKSKVMGFYAKGLVFEDRSSQYSVKTMHARYPPQFNSTSDWKSPLLVIVCTVSRISIEVPPYGYCYMIDLRGLFHLHTSYSVKLDWKMVMHVE